MMIDENRPEDWEDIEEDEVVVVRGGGLKKIMRCDVAGSQAGLSGGTKG